MEKTARKRSWRVRDRIGNRCSTFWKGLKVILANPEQVKALRGKKTDPNDSRWLASLLRHGLVQEFYSAARYSELRDLTRRRRTLVEDGAAEQNRVQKILEDANVKIGNVLTDVFGMSGQAMLEALLENKMTAEQIADWHTERLRPKFPRSSKRWKVIR